MKKIKLGERNALLISKAINIAGLDEEDIMAYIVEDLYLSDCEIVREFVKWMCANNIPYTERTAESVFSLYIKEYHECNRY